LEAETFNEALPSMGALYTMYPVLVIPEVAPDVHPYFSSGWCFSEFMSALMSKKLDMLSSTAITEYKKWLTGQGKADRAAVIDQISLSILTNDFIAKFANVFDDDIVNKRFFNEADRTVVESIVKGYLLQRLLKDAIIAQHEERVQEYLGQMQDQDLLHVLQQPLDQDLNTALHFAVALPSVKITESILDAGADPDAINMAGDTAYQWCMFPRCSAGARLCRNSAPRRYYSTIPEVSDKFISPFPDEGALHG